MGGCAKLETNYRVELLKIDTPCYLHGERRSLDQREIGWLRVSRDPHIILDGMDGTEESSRAHRWAAVLPVRH